MIIDAEPNFYLSILAQTLGWEEPTRLTILKQRSLVIVSPVVFQLCRVFSWLRFSPVLFSCFSFLTHDTLFLIINETTVSSVKRNRNLLFTISFVSLRLKICKKGSAWTVFPRTQDGT